MRKDFFISLISEKNEQGEFKYASIGRISFIIVFGLALYIWALGTGDITGGHLQMLYITATYNLMKKATWFGNVKTSAGEMSISKEEEQSPRI